MCHMRRRSGTAIHNHTSSPNYDAFVYSTGPLSDTKFSSKKRLTESNDMQYLGTNAALFLHKKSLTPLAPRAESNIQRVPACDLLKWS